MLGKKPSFFKTHISKVGALILVLYMMLQSLPIATLHKYGYAHKCLCIQPCVK